MAVSTTSDPLGSYYRYSFSYTNFPDYPKIGVWPDAYYLTFNMFNPAGTSFLGAKSCAYNRAAMLAGAVGTQQCFDTSTAYGGLLPADLDGATLPPVGEANTQVALGTTSTTLATWKFHVDWTTPANSTFTGPTTLTVPAYTEACGGGTCIPQGGTTNQLDSLADRLMFRLAYRNFGDHESLVVNHSVDTSGSRGVRWYELRLSGGNVSVFQQGTYAPDTSSRWMGSIAMDQAGNIAVGYSQSSSTTKPSIRYTGRLDGDPLGTITQGEGTIITGAGAQTSKLHRWGTTPPSPSTPATAAPSGTRTNTSRPTAASTGATASRRSSSRAACNRRRSRASTPSPDESALSSRSQGSNFSGTKRSVVRWRQRNQLHGQLRRHRSTATVPTEARVRPDPRHNSRRHIRRAQHRSHRASRDPADFQRRRDQ